MAPRRRDGYHLGMPSLYTERKVKGHVVGVERLEGLRWRVSVDGRRLFTFCSEVRARQAGTLEARRLDWVASERAPPGGR